VQYTGGPQTTGPATTMPVNPLLPMAETGSRNTLGVGNFDLEDSTLVYQFVNDNVMARMQLLANDGRINVLATPMVLASNNQPARMFVGEEAVLTRGINVDTITGAVGATTQTIEPITEIRDVGQTLFLVPKINADRTVTLMLVQDSSIVEKGGATIPVPDGNGGVADYAIDTVNTANLQATVVAKDGMTLAVGGLIRIDILDREEKVPVLGDIPIIRFFFRKKVTSREKQELILLIKPRVLFTPAEADAATKERLRALSDHPYSKYGDKAYDADLDSLRRKVAKEEAAVAKKAAEAAAKDEEKAAEAEAE
jgi:general secretion pathway protein D